MSDILGLYTGSILTLFTVSIIFKDSPIYRFAQHIFQGAALGYGAIIALKAINDIAVVPLLNGELLWLFPLILSLLFYTGFSKNYNWLARYPVSVLVGTGVALSMRTSIQSSFLAQITSTFLNPFSPPYSGTPPLVINNIIIIISVLFTVIYFTFSGGTTINKFPIMRSIRKIAIIFMMFAYGAGFANTLGGRIGVWMGRTRALLEPEARPILPVALLFIFFVLYGKELWEKMRTKM